MYSKNPKQSVCGNLNSVFRIIFEYMLYITKQVNCKYNARKVNKHYIYNFILYKNNTVLVYFYTNRYLQKNMVNFIVEIFCENR